MKIEKISEDKIRIILKREDFKDTSINIQEFLLITPKSQKLFLEILNKAKEKFNFETDGYKLLIETFFQGDDSYIFTITKFLNKNNITKNEQKKYLTVKRKQLNTISSSHIYQFNNFDDFCSLCDFFNKNNNIKLNNLFKSSILYFYNNTYYLKISEIKTSNKLIYFFYYSLLEFSDSINFTKNFEFKLQEHGKVIFKNNAINAGIKYFSYK